MMRRQTVMRCRDLDDHDEHKEDHDDIRHDRLLREFIGLLEMVERHRDGLRETSAEIRYMAQRAKHIGEFWEEFQKRGGVTSAEFKLFIAGRPFRRRNVKTKKHLTLIHNAPIKLSVTKRRCGGTSGNDAA
jgi:hypothetical protein